MRLGVALKKQSPVEQIRCEKELLAISAWGGSVPVASWEESSALATFADERIVGSVVELAEAVPGQLMLDRSTPSECCLSLAIAPHRTARTKLGKLDRVAEAAVRSARA